MRVETWLAGYGPAVMGVVIGVTVLLFDEARFVLLPQGHLCINAIKIGMKVIKSALKNTITALDSV